MTGSAYVNARPIPSSSTGVQFALPVVHEDTRTAQLVAGESAEAEARIGENTCFRLPSPLPSQPKELLEDLQLEEPKPGAL